MHLPVGRRFPPAFFIPLAAGLLAAAAAHAAALEAASADGRYRLATDDATSELVVYSAPGGR